MEGTPVLEIVQAIAESKDKDSVLHQYLKGSEGDEKLSQLLTWLTARQDHTEVSERVDQFVMYIWEYIEKDSNIWQHQYKSVDEMKVKVGYAETVLPCVARQSESTDRFQRGNRSVLKMWQVSLFGGNADDTGADFRCF
jgi:hypothetical protein